MEIWFDRLTEGLSLARDEDSATSVLARLTAEAGFTLYSYLVLRADHATAISNYPSEWQRRYLERCYAHVDPAIRVARAGMKAFRWSSRTFDGAKEQRRFMAEAVEFGIRSGLTIPVRTGYGGLALFTLASGEGDAGQLPGLDPVIAAATIAQLHVRLSMLKLHPTTRPDIRLKLEELCCLRWSAEGKSMEAIAVIENMAYANVVFHLRNAKAALGATTLPQATALAKEFGLI
ncbi:autoinducer binding domain-containing protein (plasmid) [Sinorhizobium sp. B11]